VQRSSFSWNTRAIYSRNANKIEKLTITPFVAGYTNLVIEGQPVGVHFMPTFRHDSVDAIGMRQDSTFGPIAGSRNHIAGNPWPKWTGSLFNEFRFGKNFSASFLLDGSFGAELWNQTQRIMDGLQAGARYDQVLRGELTTVQLARLRTIWESYLEDASFIKLRDLTLRYSTDGRWLRNVGASRAEFEIVGRNLKTWTDYTGYDPEINMFGLSTVERGTDFAVYPNSRTVGFGVRLTY
jgi:TonB-dependent starch-binding outer membrane protein SusC